MKSEEPNRQENLDTSKTCATCLYYYENTADPIQPGRPECAAHDCTLGPHHRACSLYSPKKTD